MLWLRAGEHRRMLCDGSIPRHLAPVLQRARPAGQLVRAAEGHLEGQLCIHRGRGGCGRISAGMREVLRGAEQGSESRARDVEVGPAHHLPRLGRPGIQYSLHPVFGTHALSFSVAQRFTSAQARCHAMCHLAEAPLCSMPHTHMLISVPQDSPQLKRATMPCTTQLKPLIVTRTHSWTTATGAGAWTGCLSRACRSRFTWSSPPSRTSSAPPTSARSAACRSWSAGSWAATQAAGYERRRVVREQVSHQLLIQSAHCFLVPRLTLPRGLPRRADACFFRWI